MIITYGEPAARLPLLLQPEFGLTVVVYILGKPPSAATAQETNLKPIIQGPFESQTMVSCNCYASRNTLLVEERMVSCLHCTIQHAICITMSNACKKTLIMQHADSNHLFMYVAHAPAGLLVLFHFWPCFVLHVFVIRMLCS
jgi:hypothetical protein